MTFYDIKDGMPSRPDPLIREAARVATDLRNELGPSQRGSKTYTLKLHKRLIEQGIPAKIIWGYFLTDGHYVFNWGEFPIEWSRIGQPLRGSDKITAEHNSHYWVRVRDYFIDIAAEQFNPLLLAYSYPPVYVQKVGLALRHDPREEFF